MFQFESSLVMFANLSGQFPVQTLQGGMGVSSTIRRFNNEALYYKRNNSNNDDLMRIDQSDTQTPTATVQDVINLPPGNVYEFDLISASQPHRIYPPDNFVYRNIGEKRYEINDHLGNVRATITDRKLASMTGVGTQNFDITAFTADIETANDYYPFGWTMPGRQYDPGEYRYGFQGQEKDDEIKGSASSVNFDYRVHDPRIGRFLSIDPLAGAFAHNSPYAFSENRVIDGVEFEGLEYVSMHIYLDSDRQTFLTCEIAEEFRGMSKEQVESTHNMPASEFYKKYSESFGKRGRGVAYTYFYKDSRNGEFYRLGYDFDKSGTDFSHGFYYGEGGPSKMGTYGPLPSPGSVGNEWTYDRAPIDKVDALARTHDMRYDAMEVSDWHSDWKGILADMEFIAGLIDYLYQATQDGYKDPYTGRPPSNEALIKAAKAIFSFGILFNHKRSSIPKNSKGKRKHTDAKF